MVRSGPFELTLVHPGGEPLPEVERNGQAYAVASPGQTFEVRFTVHPHPQSIQILNQGLFHSVSVQVDGVDVGYTKSFTCPSTGSFVGFLASGDMNACSYRSFVLSTPQASEAKQAGSLQFVEGTVQVQVRYACHTGFRAPQQWLGHGSTNESVAALPEGKKFFMQPSLTTGQGALQTDCGFSPFAYQLVGPGPIATLLLRYETPTTLLLRGVLRQDEPAHRAILQRFPETAAKEEQPAASTAAAAAAGRKRQRQRQVEGDAASGQQPAQQRRRQGGEQEDVEVVDLTKPAGGGASDEVLAARRRNQLLSCDLTGDDDAPQWEAVERPVHSLE